MMIQIEELRWRKLPVLDQGFVTLIDVMGSDEDVVSAARVSYGKGTHSVSDDRTLIRYLMRHHHSTPFEMCEIKLLVKAPMDCWRQWIRHRTANVNEYSTRYSEAIDEMQATAPDSWRLQSGVNKQGSGGMITEWTDAWDIESGCSRPECSPGEFLTAEEARLQDHATKVYRERLALGVAREQARKDLPLSNYTMAYWKCDLRNVFHFLGLRMDSHAQWEIRQYANVIGNEIVAPLFPLCWEAFRDYYLNAVTFSAPELAHLRSVLAKTRLSRETYAGLSVRESAEFNAKLAKILGDDDAR